jgi:iron complex outermembrane receptor protein
VDADPSQANATYLARRERRDNRLARVGLTLDHAIDANQGFSAMAFVTPKYLQRSERNTYRDFNRYHLGGNGVYRVAGQYADGVKGTLSIGTDAAYQDGTILFYTLSATQGRGTTLSDNKREGANNFGVFVNDDLELGDRWLLGLGARYDAVTYTYSSNITPSLNTTKGFTGVSPKVGLTFKAGTGHTWYANVGGGIEVPAGNETDPEAGTPNAVYAINPLLDPIRSTTFEIGTRRVIGFVDSPVRSLRYDVAAFRTMVSNEIVPYNGGRFYFSAAKAERTGLEVGATADLVGGWSVQGAATLMNAQYKNYVVDSVHYAKPGKSADYSNNDVVGVPSSTINATLGWAPAALGGLRLQGGISTTSSYFVDDANKVKVPAATVYNASIVTDRAYLLGNGIGVRGAVRVQNLTDRRYIASAFLNPDLLSGAPVAYEPGLPRQVIFTLSFERMR